MDKSEGKVLPFPCRTCGRSPTEIKTISGSTYYCEACHVDIKGCFREGQYGNIGWWNKPIHPNRLKAESLVPASELAALVKALESKIITPIYSPDGRRQVRKCLDCGVTSDLDTVETKQHFPGCVNGQALAHAREICK